MKMQLVSYVYGIEYMTSAGIFVALEQVFAKLI